MPENPVRHLRSVSLLIALAGLAVLLLGLTTGLDETWVLVGLLLVVAGVVKVVVVRLWRDLADGPGLDEGRAPRAD
jgi:hypothetical protein